LILGGVIEFRSEWMHFESRIKTISRAVTMRAREREYKRRDPGDGEGGGGFPLRD